MKGLLIYTGFAFKKQYVKQLQEMYRPIETSVRNLGKGMLIPPFYPLLTFPDESDLQHDMHMISGSVFPLLPFLMERDFKNKIILESPGFFPDLPQFLASCSHHHFDHKKPVDSDILNSLFHRLLATPEWQSRYTNSLRHFHERDQLLVLCSSKETIANTDLAPDFLKPDMVFIDQFHAQLCKTTVQVCLDFLEREDKTRTETSDKPFDHSGGP